LNQPDSRFVSIACTESVGELTSGEYSTDVDTERVDHRSYARQGIEMEPTVKVGHASAAIKRRAKHKQMAAGEEPHAVTPREQMNEAI
jgi:hypothetical protein